MESFQSAYKKLPEELVADAGYGSQENYLFLEQKQVTAYVKYNYFDKDRKSKIPTVSASNPELAKIRTKAYDLLTTEHGIALRKQRCHDVETVFGQIKNNKGFRRFHLKGLKKVDIEIGLIALAHNLRKMAG